MVTVGLTGGIGAGKSAVSRLLAERGAVVLDADVMAREVLEPGSPGLAAVVEAFGPEVLRPDGALDRARLASIVFPDPESLARLNAIVHPLVAERYERLTAEAAAAGVGVVVHDVPLLVENGLQDRYDVVVVVHASAATRLDRLVRSRGLDPADAAARMAAQADDAARSAVATHVLDNDGPQEALRPQVERLWHELTAGEPDGGAPSSGDRREAPGD